MWQRRLIEMLQQRAVLLAIVLSLFAMGGIAGGLAVQGLDPAGMAELSAHTRDLLTRLGREGTAASVSWQWIVLDDVLKTAGLVWLLGLSVIGVPLIAAVVFLRGFVLGFTASFLVKDLVLPGVVLAVAALLPQNLFFIPGLTLAAVGASAFSLSALRIVLGRPEGRDIFAHLRTEGSLALAGCVLLFIGGVLESYVVPPLTAIASRYLL